MKLKEINRLEDYLIKKNNSYAVDGLTKNEIKAEFLLSDDEVEKYLKRKFCYSIGEAIKLLIIINKNESKQKADKNVNGNINDND